MHNGIKRAFSCQNLILRFDSHAIDPVSKILLFIFNTKEKEHIKKVK